MSQHDMNIANQGFPAFRADLNDALGALVSNSSGATAPSTTFAHQFWMDTAADPSILKVRNADNDAWITLGTFNQTADTFTPSGVTSDKIEEGNSKVEVVDTGTGYIVFEVDGAEVARFNPDQLVTKAGTVSAPAIAPTGDLNTGIYFPAADNIGFATGGTIRGRWTTDGLCFGSDTAAANALDDYEEGTFTPTFTSTGASFSYSQQYGFYTKIGREVICKIWIRGQSSGTTSNALIITGLPFTSASTTGNFASATFGQFFQVDYPTSSNVIQGLIDPNDSQLKLAFSQDDAGTSPLTAAAVDQATSSGFILSITYIPA
jgi:hypothetical protein